MIEFLAPPPTIDSDHPAIITTLHRWPTAQEVRANLPDHPPAP
ncbi:hypothetical protein [Nibricoccus aquaticus]|nr:hypothetical protein [Nibricoccus aquaticus]